MLLPTVFVYRDPPRPAEHARRSSEVLVGAAEVLADARFMLMIVVYSGFWILYFQNFGSVLWYLRDFVDRAPVSAAVTSLLRRAGPALDLHLRRRARHRDQRRHDHPAAGLGQPHRQGLEGAAHDGDGHGASARSASCCLASSQQRLGLHPRHRGLLDRRDDRPPEVLQLRRPGRARRTARPSTWATPSSTASSARCSARTSGRFLYERMLKPALGTPEADERARDLLAPLRGARRGRGGRPRALRPPLRSRHRRRRATGPARSCAGSTRPSC